MKLNANEIDQALKTIPGWGLKDGKFCRSLRFENFIEAFAFMTKAAIISEKLNHHPEWQNVYNRVEIALATHDVGGISALDVAWAKEINALLDK